MRNEDGMDVGGEFVLHRIKSFCFAENQKLPWLARCLARMPWCFTSPSLSLSSVPRLKLTALLHPQSSQDFCYKDRILQNLKSKTMQGSKAFVILEEEKEFYHSAHSLKDTLAQDYN